MDQSLPLAYRWMRVHGLRGLTPWHFIDDPVVIEGCRAEYAREVGDVRDILPFARRQDMDTVAGFLIVDGRVTDEVVTVHLTWRGAKELPGWPNEMTSPSFQHWMNDVMMPESAEWMTEGELQVVEERTSAIVTTA